MTEQAEGLLGSSALVPESGRYLHNQRLGLVTDIRGADKYYLYHLFNTWHVRSQIRASASGVKVRHTSPSRIYEVEVEVPPLPTQRKIAAILSAYDDLIENNSRRIAILEEIARNLYRKWFVHFRYPGHQSVPLVDSPIGLIPEGWKAVCLGDLAAEVRRSVEPDDVDPTTPYIGLAHMPRQSMALTEWGTAGDTKSTKLAFKMGEILFGKIRPYFHKVGVAPSNGVCSTDTIVIVPKSESYFALVLACVSSTDFVDHATQTSKGTKMPRADWQVLVQYPVCIPPQPILSQFNDLMDSIVAHVLNTTHRNAALRRARDLLLPRLVSGQLDVSNLPIHTVSTA